MVQNETKKARVFLVEDEAAVRRGIELLLNREPDLEICGTAAGQDEALKQILKTRPQLALVDLCLAQGNGLDLVRELRAFGPDPKILIFSMHRDISKVRAALRAGANGYIAKEDGAEYLSSAIHTVLLGKCFLTETIARKLEEPGDLNSGASKMLF